MNDYPMTPNIFGTPYMSGYQPMQFGQYTQPGQMQNAVQTAQNAQHGMEVVPVQTIQQVEQVQVQPGQRKMVLVQNEPVIASRSADNMGLVATDYFRLEKFDPHAVSPAAASSANYVTPEQLEERLAAFAESIKPASKSKKEASSD